MKAILMSSTLAIAALAVAGLSMAGEPTCDARPSCAAAPPTCDSCGCCPKCGCHECMIPICHSFCTTKKVTKYHYCCKCEEICIPDHCPPCPKCGDGCCDKAGCAEGCGNDCGCESGKCKCLIVEAHKLVKIPYTVEVPVRKCTVEWVCPKCGCNCGCNGTSEPAPTPTAPTPPLPPIPGKSASAAPTRPAVSTSKSMIEPQIAMRASK
jgi:hypothetical protein